MRRVTRPAAWVKSPGGVVIPRSAVQLLLHGHGTTGSTTILNAVAYNRPVASTTNAIAGISTAQAKFGESSLFFPGTAAAGSAARTSSGCTYDTPNGSDFGVGAWSVAAWIYATALTSNSGSAVTIWSSISNESSVYRGARLFVNSTGSVSWGGFSDQSGAGSLTTATGLVTTNAWYHIAAVSTGTLNGAGTETIYVNGVARATATITGGSVGYREGSLNPWVDIGCTEGGNWRMKGYIDELLVVKGYAIAYTDFPVPQYPYAPNYP